MCDKDHFAESVAEYEARGLVTRRQFGVLLAAGVAMVALVGAAGFRATPSVMLHPLNEEFGWPLATISAAPPGGSSSAC